MKTAVIGTLALAAVLAAYVAGHSQQPPAPRNVRSTKVGVVDMGPIYLNAHRVKELKERIDRVMEPFIARTIEMEQVRKDWQRIATTSDENFSTETKDMARNIVKETNQNIVALEAEAKKVVGKIVVEGLVAINRDIHKAVARHAAAGGYHLILAYGEPQVRLKSLIDFRRRMAIVDKGGVVPVYVSPKIDISPEILKILNSGEQN